MSECPAGKKPQFVIVNACTLLNMLLGLAAVFVAAYSTVAAAWLIGASVVFDACDGTLARRWGVSSEFGAQLDSLGDFSSFSLGTGAIMLYTMRGLALPLEWAAVPAAVYMVCGAIRLARYNATTDSLCPPEYFQGLPTTGAACILAALVVFGQCQCALCWVLFTVLYGLLMVCNLPYPKLTKMAWVPKWVWLIPAVALPFFPKEVTWTCVGLYTISGPLVWWRRQGQHK